MVQYVVFQVLERALDNCSILAIESDKETAIKKLLVEIIHSDALDDEDTAACNTNIRSWVENYLHSEEETYPLHFYSSVYDLDVSYGICEYEDILEEMIQKSPKIEELFKSLKF